MANIKFSKGSIKFNKRNATFSIPIGLAKQLYADANGKQDVYFSVVNNILQASVAVPDVFIPPVILKKEFFIPQK